MKNVMTVDSIQKILAAQQQVQKLITMLLTRRAMGLAVNPQQLDCLNKYLNILRYLLLKAFQVYEINRYQQVCEPVCETFEITLIRAFADSCPVLELSATPNFVQ